MGLFEWLRGRRHPDDGEQDKTTQAGTEALLEAIRQHEEAQRAAERARRDEERRDRERRKGR